MSAQTDASTHSGSKSAQTLLRCLPNSRSEAQVNRFVETDRSPNSNVTNGEWGQSASLRIGFPHILRPVRLQSQCGLPNALLRGMPRSVRVKRAGQGVVD
jgi:hypothetical protein